MTRGRTYVWAVLALGALPVGGLWATGCGSATCTETATCPPDATDAGNDVTIDAPTSDVVGADRTVDAPPATDAPASDALDAMGRVDGTVDAPEDTTDDTTVDAPVEAEPIDAPPDAPRDVAVDAPPDTGTVVDASDAGDGGDGCANNVEDCTNGIDDNCNGAIDCADEACITAGFTCTPPWAASGWKGPVALYDAINPTGPAPSPQPCPPSSYYTQALPTASSTQVGNYTPTAQQPTCGCNCGSGTVQGVTCPFASISASPSNCSSTQQSLGTLATAGVCTEMSSSLDINSITVTIGTASGGSCSPVTETGLPVPAWNSTTGWEGTGNACWTGRASNSYFSGAAGGCTGTNVCVEPPPQTFNGGKVCLFFNGSASCPAGYATSHTYYTGATDDRTCNYSCTCTPSGVTCTPDVTLSNNSACSGTKTTPNLTINMCTPVDNYSPVWVEQTNTVGGTCALTGGAQATGQVTPTDPVTVCCN